MEWDDVKILIVRIAGFGVICIAMYFVIYPFINNDCCMCGSVENDCCPCPNKEWFDIVEKWAGYEACSGGSWYMMCNEYQEANNITFDCFE